jgi:sortase A
MRIASIVCLGLGGVGYATLAWQLLSAHRFQTTAARALAAQRAEVSGPAPLAAAATVPAIAVADPGPARLEIPRIGLSTMILDADDSRSLRKGIGRISTTARVGEIGNVGLAGHRDSFFRNLSDIAVGDTVRISTVSNDYLYVVDWTRVVQPDAVEVLEPTDSRALTLVTCYPFRYLGPAPERFVVRARSL